MPDDDPTQSKVKPREVAAPDSVHGKSIELPAGEGEVPDFARPPAQAPVHKRAAFDPRILIPLDLLDPHVPAAREVDERIKAERRMRRRLLLGVGGGLAGGVVVALIGFGIYTHRGTVAPPSFDEGVVIGVDSEPPGAAVFIDGRPTEEVTPTKLKNWDYALPHHVRLELKGFYPDDHLVEAAAHPPDIVAKLPRIAHLAMRSSPLGASVFFGDKDLGSTPTEFDLPAGRDVELKIKLAGYLPVSQHMVLQEGEKALHEVVLHAMSILSIRTEPPGVRCTVDDQPEVTTPADFFLEAGVPHQVRLVASQLPTQEKKVTLKEGKREELHFRFDNPGDRKLRARIESLQRQSASAQRKLDAMDGKGGSNDMFATFGRLKNQDKLSDAIDHADSAEQDLSDQLAQHQLELEDRLKADNLKDGIPEGTVIPPPKTGDDDDEPQ